MALLFLLIRVPLHISSLPSAKITNPDVTRLINSTEIQSVVRPANSKVQKRPWTQHKHPLKNRGVLFRLNPYAKTLRRQELRKFTFFFFFIFGLTEYQIHGTNYELFLFFLFGGLYSQARTSQGRCIQKEGQGNLR